MVNGLRALSVVGVSTIAMLTFAGSVSAAPTVEHLRDVSFSFPDQQLSAQCGVDVVTSATGHISIRTFDDRAGTGPVEVRTFNGKFIATAVGSGNTYAFQEVGVFTVRREPDGTLVASQSGRVPRVYNGVLKTDLETGVVRHEPRPLSAAKLAEVCAALTA